MIKKQSCSLTVSKWHQKSSCSKLKANSGWILGRSTSFNFEVYPGWEELPSEHCLIRAGICKIQRKNWGLIPALVEKNKLEVPEEEGKESEEAKFEVPLWERRKLRYWKYWERQSVRKHANEWSWKENCEADFLFLLCFNSYCYIVS